MYVCVGTGICMLCAFASHGQDKHDEYGNVGKRSLYVASDADEADGDGGDGSVEATVVE